MSEKSWEVVKVRYCHHVKEEVGLEAQVVYPAEWLPDQPPRVFGHRCSEAMMCNQDGRPSHWKLLHQEVVIPFFDNLAISQENSDNSFI